MKQWPVAALALVTAGCAGTTGQLSDFKKAEAAKNYAAIESAGIESNCAAAGKGSEECAQIAEIQGRACLSLAEQETAPHAACPPATASARRRLRCAADDFDVARIGHHFAAEELADFTEMRARALYCGATLMARTAGLVDAREAARELDTLPANPQRDQLAAAAALYVANSENLATTERCAAAQRAAERAARGLKNDPSDTLRLALMDTQTHTATVAAHLTNCRVPP